MLPPVSETMEDDDPTAAYRRLYLLSFWLETALYGVYFFLFVMAMISIGRRRNLDRFSTRFQVVGVFAMFILISLHNFGNVYRMLQAFVLIPLSDPRPGAPALYLRDWQKWDAMMFGVVAALLTWIGDLLVIYRCYLVWGGDYRIIVIPCMLLVTCISNTSLNLWWYRHPTSISHAIIAHTTSLTWPLNLSQNLITTGLIAYRIYSQHLQIARAGLRATFSSGAVSLVVVLRIILESAAIYTIVMFMMTVFWLTGNPAFVALTHIFVPSTGIVFALMSVRTYIAQVEAQNIEPVPSWVRDSSSFPNYETMPPPVCTRGNTNEVRAGPSQALPEWLVDSEDWQEETGHELQTRGGS